MDGRTPRDLTIEEAAGLFGVSTITISRWIKQGWLPACYADPHSVRIKWVDIESLLTRRSDPGAPTAEAKQRDLFAGYDPIKALEALRKTAGSWKDLDADKLIDELYQAREQGSRAAARP